MSHSTALRFGVLFVFALIASGAGCNRKPAVTDTEPLSPDVPASNTPMPELGPSRRLEPGVVVHDVQLTHPSARTRLWIYQPEPRPKSVPVVLIAPAGTRLFHGLDLVEEDRIEHLPYVRAGMAVVAYSISGHVGQEDYDSGRRDAEAAREFLAAYGGVRNARAALEYALAKMPGIDRQRVYAAGHSSAGVLALQFAAHDARVKACAAFAPASVFSEWFQADEMRYLQQLDPRLPDFLRRESPDQLVGKNRCPVLLFQAEDDTNVSSGMSERFAAKLKAAGVPVTFVRAKTGGHFDAMVSEGLPRAVNWFQELPAPE
jgi:dipeptidyl aminopeptidase/acylaminoacyl peptidase